MKKHRVGHYNEEKMAKKKAELAAKQDEQKAAADAISVGSRCKVQIPEQPTKLGTVMYVGKCGKILAGFLAGLKSCAPEDFLSNSANFAETFFVPLHNQTLQNALYPLFYTFLH